MMKRVTILGSTGSIGTQALDVISHHPQEIQIEGLGAGTNIALLIKQIHNFHPKKVSVATKGLAQELRSQVPASVQIYYGEEGLLEIAANTEAHFVINALVGSQGLKPTLAAIEARKDI